MLRWSLLLLALALLPLALLTVVKSPDWSEWKLALLAADGRVLAEHKSFLWEKPAK